MHFGCLVTLVPLHNSSWPSGGVSYVTQVDTPIIR